MLKTVYFVDVSGSVPRSVLDFSIDLVASLPGPSFAIDSGGVYEMDASLRQEMLDGKLFGGGGATGLPSDPRWDDYRKVFLTDGDVPDYLAAKFDLVMEIKDRASELVRKVMTD